MLHIQFFGVFSATGTDEQSVAFPTNKVRALFAYLLFQRGQWVPRTRLATLLWSEMGEEAAQKNLRNSLSRLRQSLGEPSWIESNRQAIRLTPAPGDLWLDCSEFDHYWQQIEVQPAATQAPEWMVAAAQLYRDDFLSSLVLAECESFEAWRRQQQESYHNKVLLLLNRLGEGALAAANYAGAASFARRQLALEAWREPAHRQLMRALAGMGDLNGALSQYEICCKTLLAELQVKPDAETTTLYAEIRHQRQQQTPSSIWSEALSSASHRPSLSESQLPARSTATRHNLPLQLTPFIGRATELAHLQEDLRNADYRLHVIAGMGGAGKSRLALQAATLQLDHFADGVFWVALAEVKSVDEVVIAIARAIHLPVYEQQPLYPQLLVYLKPRHLLLVLDNIEHLLDPPALHENGVVALLLELLQQSPRLSLLVTSRHQLNVRAENLFLLDGLSYPSQESIALARDEDDPLGYDAVQFFVEHAQRVNKRFTLEEELSALIQICQLLQGMPLGLELAAADVQRRHCSTIYGELARNLAHLQSGFYDLPPRQRSLQAVFDYSWNLLPTDQQQLLARCTIFQGGFSWDNLRALLPNVKQEAVNQLVEHCLLQPFGEDRYRFHALVQQCASAAQVLSSLEQARLAMQHSRYFLDKILHYAEALHGLELPALLAAFAEDWANVQAAWQWALHNNQFTWLDEALDGFFAIYVYRRHHEAGLKLWQATATTVSNQMASSSASEQAVSQRLLTRLQLKQARHLFALDRQGEASLLIGALLEKEELAPALEFEGLLIKGWIERLQDETDRQRCDELSQQISDPHLLGDYWRFVASYHVDRGRFDEGCEASLKSQALYRSCGDVAGQAMALRTRATICHHRGQLSEAQGYLEQALCLAQQRQDAATEGFIHEMLGIVYSRLGDHSAALHSFAFSAETNCQIERYNTEQMMLTNLALEYTFLGKYEEARQLYESSLDRISQQLGTERQQCYIRLNLGLLLHTIGEEQAAEQQSHEALRLAQVMQLPSLEAYALTNLGHSLSAMGCWYEASDAYQAALALRQQLGEAVQVLETQAGLARLALAQQDLTAARQAITPILHHLQSATLDGAEEPLRIYLTCYQVLLAAHDPAATPLAQTIKAKLRELAQRISDPALRYSFLNQVPYHREIGRLA